MLTEKELAEIRAGVKEGIRGPVLTKWAAMMLADHDERVERDRQIAARLLAVTRLLEGA